MATNNGNIVGAWTRGESLTAQERIEILEDHAHSITKTYPGLAGGVTLIKAAGAWAAYPAPTEIVPAATITDIFDIHWLQLHDLSANGEYMIALYQGAALSETLIAEIPVDRNAVQSQEGSIEVLTPLMAAGTRISGALSSANAAANTVVVKVSYHEY